MKTRLVWKLLPSYLLILLVSVGALTWVSSRTMRAYQLSRTRESMFTVARVVAARIVDTPSALEIQDLMPFYLSVDRASGYRLTVVRPDGVVVGDSRGDVPRMENHGSRPEVREALAGRDGQDIHFSPTLHRKMLYVAVPVRDPVSVIGVVRASIELEQYGAPDRGLRGHLLWAAVITGLLAVFMSVAVARGIARPIEGVARGVRQLAAGDLEKRLPELSIREFDELSATVNGMARQLSERIDTVTRQRDEQEALFACMAEGVLAVDRERRIIALNRAGESLFGVAEADVRGRNVAEAIRNADLHRLIDDTLAGQGRMDGELFIPDGQRFIQVSGRLLRGPSNGPRGAVLVMNDVTRMRRLESMRRDFVANVSHELKTPITAIKGFADTLLDGEHEPKTTQRFMEKIARQANRLNTLIEDILALSRVEHATEKGEVDLARGALAPVLRSAVRSCQSAAGERGSRVQLTCADDLAASINGRLLETAVTNLIDNAIKYGNEHQVIQVQAERDGGGCRIEVRDEGPGIPKAHWDRLFERFYRVDSGRSRSQGGTGLGLAIVKHVALAHGGSVSVAGEPGKGSTFTIRLP